MFGQARRRELRGRMAGDSAERTLLAGRHLSSVLAPDGSQMLFQEWGEAEDEGSTYHWRMGGPTPTRSGTASDWRLAGLDAALVRRRETTND